MSGNEFEVKNLQPDENYIVQITPVYNDWYKGPSTTLNAKTGFLF